MPRSKHFQEHAALIAKQNEGPCTIRRTEGTSVLYQLECHCEVLRGWLHDGEAIADIKWQNEKIDGWPKEVT